MNKLKLKETPIEEKTYTSIIYSAFEELRRKQLAGIISEVELQEYYDKHHLIINYFKSNENSDTSEISFDEDIKEEQSLLIAGLEEGEASSASAMDEDDTLKNDRDKVREKLKKFEHEYNEIKKQKDHLERLTRSTL